MAIVSVVLPGPSSRATGGFPMVKIDTGGERPPCLDEAVCIDNGAHIVTTRTILMRSNVPPSCTATTVFSDVDTVNLRGIMLPHST